MSHFGNYKSKRKYHFIYKTTNLVNGRYYYGMHSTDNLNDDYLGSGHRLWKAIRKYGKENFKREIIEFCEDREKLVAKEKEIVNLNEVAKKDCMNMQLGGCGGFSSQQHQQRCSKAGNDAFRKKAKTDKKLRQQLKKIAVENLKNAHKEGKIRYDTFTGKHHTEETKRKLSLAGKKRIGKLNSQFNTIWITNGIENRKIKKNIEIPENWYKGRVL